jgi:enamine deaminase RidA (YjgF/YER057c/UK114 family)
MVPGVSVEQRLAELEIELPPAPSPLASYIPARVVGGLAFVSGTVAMEAGRPLVTGRVGDEVTVERAREAARRCALQSLAILRQELGSLDRLTRIVQLTVYVASAPGFSEQPAVANGASDLLVEVLGEDGRHARAAVGVAELPLGAPVEVAVIAEVAAPD